jgi:hypothetical protein
MGGFILLLSGDAAAACLNGTSVAREHRCGNQRHDDHQRHF